MKWSRVILVIQALLIFLLVFMLWIQGEEHTGRIAVPVEICHEAKIESVLWQSTIETKNADLKLATEKLESDRERVIRNFTAKGLSRDEIEFQSIIVQKNEDGENDMYHLRQIIEVRSQELERVRRIREESGELLKFRIQFNTTEPTYQISDFQLWLRSAIPILVQEGKTLLKDNKKSGVEGDLKLHSWKLHPIFKDNYELCQPLSMNVLTAGVAVKIRATLLFVLR